MKNSSENYILLFKILGEATGGTDFEAKEKFGEEIIEIAGKNGVLGMIIPELKKYYDLGLLNASKEALNSIIMNFSVRVANYSKKQYAVNEVIKKLEKCGIPCVVLKGDTLSVMYKNPDFRMSNDTDILIDKKHEKKCLKFFKTEKSYIKKRTVSNNQSVAVHPRGGVFEIHISMDTKQVSEVWYDSIDLITEPFREVKVGGMYTYKTLGYTDNAINLTLHFIKHFIGGIAHLRMMTDTVLYFEKYYDKIDFERFWSVLRHLKYENITQSLMYIGGKYYGFSHIKYDEKYAQLANKIISDIADCCNYGYEELEKRGGIYEAYSEKRFSTFKKKGYKKYKLKILLLDSFDLIFKDKFEMKKLYPVLERYGFLLPFMYCHRAVNCLWNTVFPKAKPDEKNEELDRLLKQKTELIDELDMA